MAVVAVAPLAIGVKYSVRGFGSGTGGTWGIDLGIKGTAPLAFACASFASLD